MKAYVHTLEAVLAVVLLISAYVFAVKLMTRDPAVGAQSPGDLRETAYRALDYLNIKGVLANITASEDWGRLQMYLDKIFLDSGIGYELTIYRSVNNSVAEKVAVIVSGYNDESPSRDQVVYTVYPPHYLSGGDTVYVFMMRLSR